MIETIIFKRSDDVIGFQISGHANFSKQGSDIVCAAVSMLAINTVNAIEKFTEDKFEVAVNDGEGFLSFKMTSEISPSSKTLLDALLLGLTNVEEEYSSKYINIKSEEV